VDGLVHTVGYQGFVPISRFGISAIHRGGAFHAIADGEHGLTSQLTVTVLAGVAGSSSPLLGAASSVTRCNAVDNSPHDFLPKGQTKTPIAKLPTLILIRFRRHV
jgi:hypothetical protein